MSDWRITIEAFAHPERGVEYAVEADRAGSIAIPGSRCGTLVEALARAAAVGQMLENEATQQEH